MTEKLYAASALNASAAAAASSLASGSWAMIASKASCASWAAYSQSRWASSLAITLATVTG